MRLATLAFSLLLTACPAPTTAGPAPSGTTPAASAEKGSVSEVDIATFAKKKEAGEVPLVVDVRTDDEYAAGHVAGTVHIPLDQIGSRLAELESHKAQPVYVICQSGARSARASKILAADGYQAVNVQGGTGGWIAAGHPVEK